MKTYSTKPLYSSSPPRQQTGALYSVRFTILKDVVTAILADKGITLEVVEVTDYVTPNTLVNDGDVFANYFAHQPYQDSFNAENNTDLVTIAGVHVEPMALYGGSQETLEALGIAK